MASEYAKKIIGIPDKDFDNWFTNTFKKTESGTLNFEAHHVIPVDVLEKNKELKQLLFDLQKNNPNFEFDFNGLDNGMMIQKKSIGLDISGHAKHNRYNDAISEKITETIQRASGDNILALSNVKKLINKAKSKLKSDVLLGNKDVNDLVDF